MEQLPTTAIGLIGFVVIGAGALVWRVITKFMTYIETKNHNLERATDKFIETTERGYQANEKLADELKRFTEKVDSLTKNI